jgi:hypothetical protein
MPEPPTISTPVLMVGGFVFHTIFCGVGTLFPAVGAVMLVEYGAEK